MALWLVICEAALSVTASSAASAESYARDDAGEFMADNDHTITHAFEVSPVNYSIDDEVRISASVEPEDGEEEPDEDDDEPGDIGWNAVASLEVIVEADSEMEAHATALARLALGNETD